MRFACHGPRLWLVYERRRQWRTQSVCVSLPSSLCVPTQPGPQQRKSNYLIPPCFGCQLLPDPVFLSCSRGLGRRYVVDRLPHRRLHPALHSRFLRSSIGKWVMISQQSRGFRFVNWTTIGIFLLFAIVSQFQALIAGQRRSQTVPSLFYYFRKAINILFD